MNDLSQNIKDSEAVLKEFIEGFDELKDVKSEDGEYIIPVEWSVYSTITVTADNLADAIAKAHALQSDIPLCSDPEYVDGSYKIAINTTEDAINAQSYRTIGNVEIDYDGNINS